MADFRIHFYQNLSTLLSAGLPLLRALRTMQQRSPLRHRRILSQLEKEVSGGTDLSEAMAARRRLFDPLDSMLVRIGEQTGQLAEIFKSMSEWYQQRQKQRRMIQSGLIYPAFILHFGAFLSPIPSAVLGGGWPLYFRQMFGILALFYIPVGLFWTGRMFSPKKGFLRRVIDYITLFIPLFGSAVRCLAIGRYSSVFSIMYKAGIPILRCAELAPKTCGNSVIAGQFEGGYAAAKTGVAMSEGFSRTLPPEFLELWAIGEESGDLDKTSGKLAQIYMDKAQFRFELFSQWMPKIIYFAILIFMAIQIVRVFMKVYGGIYNDMLNNL